MSASSTRRELQNHFKRQHGLCIWCGVEMQLTSGDPDRSKFTNPATYEHFYNRKSPLRRKYGNLGYAACHKCNSARGTFDMLLAGRGFDISDIWDRPCVKRLAHQPPLSASLATDSVSAQGNPASRVVGMDADRSQA